MAPKKKSNKKADDDWEAELGESIAPANQTEKKEEPQADAAAPEEDDDLGGGLLAALRKNKNKKAKKGKPTNDFVEGEDLASTIESKQPEEGTFDEDDVFAGKPKPAKGAAKKEAAKPAESEEGGKLKSKKEKEREKKEREKQRKKEQVRYMTYSLGAIRLRCTVLTDASIY